MKIVMLNTHDSVGGAAVACRRLIESIQHVDSSIEITLLVREKTGELDYVKELGAKYNLYLEKLFFWFSEKSKETRFSFSTNTFGTDISRNKYIQEADILHFHWVSQGFLSLTHIEKLLKLGKPVFWTFHDMWPMTGGCHHSRGCTNFKDLCGNCDLYLKNSNEKDISNQILLRKLIWEKRKDINIISISSWMTERIKSSKLFSENPLYSIPNPIDSSIFKPFHKNERNENHQIAILVVAATIDNDFKGFDMLIEIAEMLSTKYPNKFHLNLVGKISESSLAKLKLPTKVYGLISEETQMVKIYGEADIFLSTSPDESFSYTCLEALSCGTSVIAYKTGAISSFIEQFKRGYLVQDYSLECFQLNFEKFIESSNREETIYANDNPFSYKEIGKKMKELYTEVLTK